MHDQMANNSMENYSYSRERKFILNQTFEDLYFKIHVSGEKKILTQ